ncbi:MAG: glycosyltransferase family 2 protein [Vicinamibacteria bacterium]|nr:glycosyltransferase family 2 protein [Vicinamibacteria bacterium]
MPGLSIVIPAYNSGDNLTPLVDRLAAALPELADAYEVILVNDGSRDGTWDRIRNLAKDREWIRGIDLQRNYGQHNALLCGIRAARHDVIVTMDDDLQHPPEEIRRLLDRLAAEGADVVYGTAETQQHGLWRNLASRMTKKALASAVGAANAGNVSAFRAFRSQVRGAFEHYHGPSVSIDVLLSWGTTRFAAQRVRHDARRLGVSNYTFRKLASHALEMMTGFSTWPLRVASLVGFSATLFGLGVLAYVLIRYIIAGGSVPGFPFLAAIITIFSGAQLFALGVMGEYLARMHNRAMDRPTYAVREDTGTGSAAP